MRIRTGLLAAAVFAVGSTVFSNSVFAQSATTQPDTTQSDITQSEPATEPAIPAPPAGRLKTVVVTSQLDVAREEIAPSLGAVTYSIGPAQIEATPEGENAPFQQVLLRSPGVV